jgi:hypothetical protein
MQMFILTQHRPIIACTTDRLEHAIKQLSAIRHHPHADLELLLILFYEPVMRFGFF